MNLNNLIAAANLLYTDSPAKYINEKKDSILVYGDDDIASCLFDMLFSTSFLPNHPINLVRVTSNEEDALDFFTRNNNEQEMRCFADNALLDQETRNMPLCIHFYTYTEKEKWQSHSFACAYAPENVDLSDLAAKPYRFNEITLCTEENHIWSRDDEEKFPVLRIARKVHTAYTAGWNDRYRDKDIDREFYGSLTEEPSNDYILRSNLRFAVSIPWKMRIAGAEDAEGMYNSLQNKANKIEKHTSRDYLAWQEHRSWLAFMTLEGWCMSEPKEMTGENSYIYKNGNDHRNKEKKWHPCLCDLTNDDWFTTNPNRISLTKKPHSQWSNYYKRYIDRFSSLDQISLRIHHQCKEIVLSSTYRETMHDLFSALENVLIEHISENVDQHFQRLRLIENMFTRLQSNETNSYHPFERACSQFMEELLADKGLTSEAKDSIQKKYQDVRSHAKVAVERNKYCDYREIDSKILDWLPWIIGGTDIDTIWKLYTGSMSFDNIFSSLILRPKKLYLVHSGEVASLEDAIEIYKAILSKRGLSGIEIHQISLASFNRELRSANDDVVVHHAIDVSNSGNMQNYIRIPPHMHIIFYDNGRLRDSATAPGCAKYYPQKLTVTVDEFLQMRGYKNLSIREKNDILGMENDYKNLWKIRKTAVDWNNVIIPSLKEGERAIKSSVYAGNGQTKPREFTSRIDKDSLGKLVKNGCIRVLFDLQRMGAISGLSIDPDQGISLKYFPNNDNRIADGYNEPLNTLRDMLSNTENDSLYVVDDVYVDDKGRIPICDLKRPIFIEDAHAFNRIDKFLVNTELMNKVIVNDRNCLTYKSPAVRHGLKEGGFALEAYVYYTLFLSGRFDDVRSNVRMYTGEGRDGRTLEKELDILVTLNGKMCVISCKDTKNIKERHIFELFEQSETYGNANSILICSKYNELDADIIEKCESLHVQVIGDEELNTEQDSRKQLVDKVLNVLS